eukprot:1271768-Pyramimonas_sp.AAC.1
MALDISRYESVRIRMDISRVSRDCGSTERYDCVALCDGPLRASRRREAIRDWRRGALTALWVRGWALAGEHDVADDIAAAEPRA